MKTKVGKLAAFSALILLAFGLSVTPAEAQFGNLLKKAKNVVKEKVEKKAGDLKDDGLKAAETGQKPAFMQNLKVNHTVPLPWPMEKDETDPNDGPVAKYIDSLGDIPLDSAALVGDLKQAILARAHEDSLEIERLKPYYNDLSSEEKFKYDELQKELDRADNFFSGAYYRAVGPYFSGSVDMEQGTISIDNVLVRTRETSYYIIPAEDNNIQKSYIYNQAKERVFVDGEELKDLVRANRRFTFVALLLSGSSAPQRQEQYQQALVCSKMLLGALKLNSPENIQFQPMPKPGALNSLASQALAATKARGVYPDAEKVIIDTDSWDVETNALGVPIRRKAGGWVITNTKYGKKAYRVMFSEDYQGGGYGPIKFYGAGLGEHYVK